MERMQETNMEIRQQSVEWRKKYESLKKFAIENKIPIPPGLESTM